MNTSVEDLSDYFEKKYRVDVPGLRVDHITADQNETQIDVSQDRNRHIRDRSRPFYIKGTAIVVSVPFDGDAEVFKIRPTTFNSNLLHGEVRGGALVLTIEGIDLAAEKVREEIDRTLSRIETYLTSLGANAQGFNAQVRTLAREEVHANRRKSRLR